MKYGFLCRVGYIINYNNLVFLLFYYYEQYYCRYTRLLFLGECNFFEGKDYVLFIVIFLEFSIFLRIYWFFKKYFFNGDYKYFNVFYNSD